METPSYYVVPNVDYSAKLQSFKKKSARVLKRIEQLLDTLSIPYKVVNHPAIFTMEDNFAMIQEANPVKNLLLQEKGNGQKFLVIMRGAEHLDTQSLRGMLGTRKLQFASEEVLWDTLGVRPGSASLFGLLHKGAQDVQVIFDKALLAETQEVGFHPNDNTATVYIPTDSIESLMQQFGNKYVIADVCQPA